MPIPNKEMSRKVDEILGSNKIVLISPRKTASSPKIKYNKKEVEEINME